MTDAVEATDAVQSSVIAGQVKSFASGGVGGVCAVLVGHPFDLIKVRLQTAEAGVYSGAMDALRKTVAADGLLGVYRGVTPPLLGVTPMFALSFWGYDLGKRIVSQMSTGPHGELSIAQISAAGFFSAVPMTVVSAPFERIKVLLQLQGQAGQPKYNGPIDVVRHLYREGGLRFVFRGTAATLARDGPGSAIYFATYEIVKEKLTPENKKLSVAAISFAGGCSGVAMWAAVFPIDTIKSQLQASTSSAAGGKSTGILQISRQIYRRGGVAAFFPGIWPALARSFPANAATFLGVEYATKLLDRVL
ncbi:mitochondrial carrier domain-containing protein [Dipodascopsis tothii]|uniref:mitochondrial carrier domain-containing protein n=1 Tax=Dipodascopsis tothii TaxID=44089 RepID=UPI0034CFE278